MIEKVLAVEEECEGKVGEQPEQTLTRLKRHQLERQIVKTGRTLAERRTVAKRS